jgi:hypothetical protein
VVIGVRTKPKHGGLEQGKFEKWVSGAVILAGLARAAGAFGEAVTNVNLRGVMPS